MVADEATVLMHTCIPHEPKVRQDDSIDSSLRVPQIPGCACKHYNLTFKKLISLCPYSYLF